MFGLVNRKSLQMNEFQDSEDVHIVLLFFELNQVKNKEQSKVGMANSVSCKKSIVQ